MKLTLDRLKQFKESNKFQPEILSIDFPDGNSFALIIDLISMTYKMVNSTKIDNENILNEFQPLTGKKLSTVKDVELIWKAIIGYSLTKINQ